MICEKEENEMINYTHSHKGYDFGEQTSKTIGACIEVHKVLGTGLREVDYQRALVYEFPAHGLDFSREVHIPIYYKGHKITTKRVDFVVGDCIVEIKAKHEFDPEDYMQTLAYLKASGYKVALLINFGRKKIEVKRLVN